MLWRPDRRYSLVARTRARRDWGSRCPRNSFSDRPCPSPDDPTLKSGPLNHCPLRTVLSWAQASAWEQHLMDPLRRCNAFRRGIHNLRSTIRAIAASEDPSIVARYHQASLSLSNRDDHHVARNCFAAGGGPHLDSRDGTRSVGDDALRSRVEAEAASVVLGELVFVVIARHVGPPAAVHGPGPRRPQPPGPRYGGDGGIAPAQHPAPPPPRRFPSARRLR